MRTQREQLNSAASGWLIRALMNSRFSLLRAFRKPLASRLLREAHRNTVCCEVFSIWRELWGEGGRGMRKTGGGSTKKNRDTWIGLRVE